MANKLPTSFHCPVEFVLTVLGGKWKTIILCFLRQRPCRYSELRKLIPSLSDKVLTERLRDLQSAGLIVYRSGNGGAATGTYALADRGLSLGEALDALADWGQRNAAAFGVDVGDPMRMHFSHPEVERGVTRSS